MNKFQKWCAFVAVISGVLPTALHAVQADDLEQHLASVYQNRKFTLSKPYCGAELQFDAKGKLVQGGTDGAWTLCQDVLVKEIHRTGDLIHIAGQRIYLRYDIGKRRFREVNEEIDLHSKKYKDLVAGQQVAIQISLPAGQDTAAVQAAIDRVLGPMDLSPLQPDSELWLGFLTNLQKTGTQEAYPQKTDKGFIPFKNGEVLRVGNGVTAPQIVNTPDPSYTDEAREARFQGTGVYSAIIDHEGKVTRVSVIRPLGLGLDETAAQAVRTWQFKPALKDGRPVAVAVNIEVKFNLF